MPSRCRAAATRSASSSRSAGSRAAALLAHESQWVREPKPVVAVSTTCTRRGRPLPRPRRGQPWYLGPSRAGTALVRCHRTGRPTDPSLMKLSEGLGPWFQDHDCGLRRPKSRIGVQPRIQLAPPCPQTRPFISLCGAGPHKSGPVGEIDSRIRLRLEVEPPGRFAVTPAVHRHRDEVRPVLEVGDYHAALPARATSSGREAQCAPAVRPRTPQSDSATGDAVQRAVHGPREPDEPARRKSRSSLAFVRHGPPITMPLSSLADRAYVADWSGSWDASHPTST